LSRLRSRASARHDGALAGQIRLQGDTTDKCDYVQVGGDMNVAAAGTNSTTLYAYNTDAIGSGLSWDVICYATSTAGSWFNTTDSSSSYSYGHIFRSTYLALTS